MRFLFYSFIFLFFIIFSGCSNVLNLDSSFDDDFVKIGFMGPLSGEASSYGISMLDVVNYSINEVNINGGFNGKKGVLVIADSHCSMVGGKRAIEELILKGVKIVIGGICSDSVLGSAEIAKENGVLLFSPSASSHKISEFDNVFRNTVSNERYAKFLANKAFEDGFRRTAIITEFSAYTDSLKNTFVEEFEVLGGEVIYVGSFGTLEDDISYLHNDLDDLDIDFLTLFFQHEISIKHFFSYYDLDYNFIPIYAGPTFLTAEDLIILNDLDVSLKVVGINFNKSENFYKLAFDIENFYNVSIFDSVPNHYLLSSYEVVKIIDLISEQGNCDFEYDFCFVDNIVKVDYFESFFGILNFSNGFNFDLEPSIFIFNGKYFVEENELE